MKKQGLLVLFLIIALIFFIGLPSVMAVTDTFYVEMGSNNDLISGGGSGYENGTWYYYPNTEWWNQWFYNAPFDPDRWKVIDISFNIETTGLGSAAVVAYNWSTPEWSALGLNRPPLPEDVPTPELEEKYIERHIFLIESDWIPPSFRVEDHFEILDYNPEWVSIDVRGANFRITDGVIDHRCVPIPSTLLLLGSGFIGLIGIKKKLFRG